MMDNNNNNNNINNRRSSDTVTSSDSSSSKRIKFSHGDHEMMKMTHVVVQLESQYCNGSNDMNFPKDGVVSSDPCESCDHVSSSSCLNQDLSLDLVKVVNMSEDFVSSSDVCDHVLSSSCFNQDLSKVELCFEKDTSGNDGFREETSPSSEICLDSNEMESSSTLKQQSSSPPPAADSCCKQLSTAIMPTEAEIDEFFAVMEKKEQKRFADKYNYDILNDVPMEGRYQWVLLKQ